MENMTLFFVAIRKGNVLLETRCVEVREKKMKNVKEDELHFFLKPKTLIVSTASCSPIVPIISDTCIQNSYKTLTSAICVQNS